MNEREFKDRTQAFALDVLRLVEKLPKGRAVDRQATGALGYLGRCQLPRRVPLQNQR